MPYFTQAQNIRADHSIFNDYHNSAATDEKEVLATLMPVERGGHINGCMKGTRQDVLKEINAWLDDFTEPNIFLIRGSPGAGKSTIAATMVSNLDRRKRLGSSLAFKYADAVLSDPSVVWRTVASDLARFDTSIKNHLLDALRGVDPGRSDMDLQFRRLIDEPLTRSQDKLSYNPPVVVLDALDECGAGRSRYDQRRRFLDTLTQWHNLPRTFKLIVTSRDEGLPNSFRQVCKSIVLETGNRVGSGTSNDIRHFLQTRFREISDKYSSLSRWPGESTIELLTKRAAGLFIWAETLVRFVDNEKYPPNDQLNLVLRGNIGEDVISGLYQRILDMSFGDSDEHIINAFHAIVGTIVLAKVPLCRGDLARFIPIKESVIDLILNKLSSVISIGKCDGVIHICHLSFADFICDTTRPKLVIDRAFHSQNLARACFRLMKDNLRFNICGLKTSHLRNDEVQDLPEHIQKSISSSLSYACRFGVQHLRDTPHDGSAMTLLKDIEYFLHVQFLHWLEVMSLTKEVPAASTAMFSMAQWIATSNKDDKDLVAFATDAARFIVNFADPISTSTPHIYLSALPWSPRDSTIARHFLPKFPRTLSIQTGQDNNWSAAVNILVGHAGAVTSVAFSSDGKRVVSGSHDRTVRIWDAETGEGVGAPFMGHTQRVTSVGFSPNGGRVVSGSQDMKVRIWDAETGEEVVAFEGHAARVTSVMFSPDDGESVISGSRDKTIRIWDPDTGRGVREPIKSHTDWVTSVALSPDGKCIVSGSFDNTIHITNAETGEEIAGPLAGHRDWVTSVGFSPDGTCVVSGSSDKTIRIWDAKTGNGVAGPFEYRDWITSVGFSPDGHRVVFGSQDKTIRIWDAGTGEEVAGPFEGHTDWVRSVAFSPDGMRIVSGSEDHTIRIWDAETAKVASPFGGHTLWITSVSFSRDGKRVVSGSADQTIRVWDAMTGAGIAGPFEGHTLWVTSVAFSPDGERIVSGSADKTIRIWDINTGEEVTIEGHKHWVTSVSFSPDGMCVVSGSADRTIRVWDVNKGVQIAGPFMHNDWVRSVCFSPDGSRVVSGSQDRMVRIWDLKMRVRVERLFQGHKDWVTSVQFSPDGKRVVSGSSDKTIRVWDAETGEGAAGPFVHRDWVTSVGFSHDGERVVTGSQDRTIHIWDIETGKEVGGPFEGHTNRVTSVGFSPDGQRIISGSSDKTIRIWHAETGEGITGSLGGHVTSRAGESSSLIRYSSNQVEFRRCHFDSIRSWMKTANGQGLLFWVPLRHRGTICGTDTTTIMGADMTRVDLSNFVHGPCWESALQFGEL